MIWVLAKLFATLRAYRPELGLGEAVRIGLPEGATVRNLLAELGVPESEIKLIFVNGLACDLDHPLAPGDELGLFPPVGGG